MASSVIKILKEYLAWEQLKAEPNYNDLSWEEKDKLRLKYDNDAKYYHEELKLEQAKALKADTVTSFWTPYKTLLSKEAGWTTYKTRKALASLIDQINAEWYNEFTPKIKAVNAKVEPFAKVCYTPGNFMLLPNRQMNNQRYQITTDRIDMSLDECFGKGALSGFFKNEKELVDWIVVQNRSSVFVGRDICRREIEWFVREDNPKLISEMNVDEIYAYLDKATELIRIRAKELECV